MGLDSLRFRKNWTALGCRLQSQAVQAPKFPGYLEDRAYDVIVPPPATFPLAAQVGPFPQLEIELCNPYPLDSLWVWERESRPIRSPETVAAAAAIGNRIRPSQRVAEELELT